jgi:hypothetical protein
VIYLQPSQLRCLSQDPRHPQRETAGGRPLVHGITLQQGRQNHPPSHGRLLQRTLQNPQASGILREHQADRGVQDPGGAFGGPAIGRVYGSDGSADTSQAGRVGGQYGIKRALMGETEAHRAHPGPFDVSTLPSRREGLAIAFLPWWVLGC